MNWKIQTIPFSDSQYTTTSGLTEERKPWMTNQGTYIYVYCVCVQCTLYARLSYPRSGFDSRLHHSSWIIIGNSVFSLFCNIHKILDRLFYGNAHRIKQYIFGLRFVLFSHFFDLKNAPNFTFFDEVFRRIESKTNNYEPSHNHLTSEGWPAEII